MHSRLLSLRSAAALVISVLLVLVAFEPAVAEPAPAPSATVASEPAAPEESPEPVDEQPAPEAPEPQVEEAPSAPVEEAPAAGAPVFEALKAERVDDGALSELVTVENIEVPEDTLRALSATDDSILEKVDLSPFHMAAVSWDPEVEATGVSIGMSVRVAGEWTEWEELGLADGEGSPSASDPLWTSEPADGVRARVTSDQGALPDLKITAVDPGPEDIAAPEGADQGRLTSFASVAQPAIITRNGWGAGPGQSCDATRGSMRSVVIHHTAGANSYSKAQSAGIVRSYQTMHIVTNGWCDIGYNFLVDKYGQIFEGRAGSIAGHKRGAHAGVGAVNDNSTGIAMMGNFETANIWNSEWSTLRSTVTQLTAWRLQRFGLKPLTQVTLAGRTNFTVNGHRNWMSTACPGRYGLDWLNAGNGLRADVDKLMVGGTPKPTKLGKPTGLTKSAATADSATLSWKAVPNAQSYRIFWRDTKSSTPIQIDTASGATSVKIPGLKSGATYTATISALAPGYLQSDYYKPNLQFTALTKLAAPTGFTRSAATADSATLSWKAVPNAQSYRIFWRDTKSSTPIQIDTASGATSVKIPGLKSGATYTATISALAPGYLQSDYVKPNLQFAPLTKLATPTGFTKTAATADSATLSWKAVPNAESYRIFWRDTKSSTPIQIDTPKGATSVKIPGLKVGATYTATISALGSDYAQSDYVKPNLPFTTLTKLATPTGFTKTAATADSATLVWKAVPNAESYRIFWRDTKSSTPIQIDTPKGATSVVIRGLKPDATYTATISALATGHPQSDYVKPNLQFTALTKLATPTGLTKTEATTDSATLSWKAVPNAQSYRIFWRDTKSKTPIQIDTPSGVTSVKIPGLKVGATYTATISALAPGHLQSDYLKPNLQFTALTKLATPTGFTKSAATADSATLSWKAVPNAQSYRIFWRDTKSSTPIQIDTAQGATSVKIPGLKSGATYTATISALAPGHIQGDYVKPNLQFTPLKKLAKPTGFARSAVTTTSATLSWKAVPNAQSYRIYWRDTNSSTPIRLDTPKGATSATISGLKPGTTYTATISALGSGHAQSDYSKPNVQFTTTAAAGSNNSATFSNGSVTMKGHGYGHGVGMSQYGAQGGALQGNSYEKILAHYYPSTKLATRTSHVRVQISDAPTDALTVVPTKGLMVQSAGGGPNKVLPERPDGRRVDLWQVVRAGDTSRNQLRYNTGGTWHNHGGTWRGDVQFGVDSGTVRAVFGTRNRGYRGVIRWAVGTGATRTTVNELFSLDDYIRGVVPREMPASWHQQALRSQAVAARTYTVRTMNPSSPVFDICDTTACQVYGGLDAETAATNTAIDATKGRVLMYGNTPAFTQYSSSSGGYTNWPSYPSDHPYLKPVKDDWDAVSSNANHSWTTTLTAAAVSRAYPQVGTPQKIQVTARNGYGSMGGRVDKVRITGNKGSVEVTGNGARTAFGLKSNWFGF